MSISFRTWIIYKSGAEISFASGQYGNIGDALGSSQEAPISKAFAMVVSGDRGFVIDTKGNGDYRSGRIEA